MASIRVTWPVFHSEMFWLKASAPSKALAKFFTLPVFQPEMSWLKLLAWRKVPHIPMALLKSHREMSALNCVESKVPPDPSFSCRWL
jgi:hypothetical protein